MTFLLLEGTALFRVRNLRRLVPAGMTGLLLTGIHVGLPQEWMFLKLVDTGPVSDNTALTLLLQSVGGPVAAMWFAQSLGPSVRTGIFRILQFSLMSMAFWWMAVEAGRAIWLGPAVQMTVNMVWYSLVYLVHLYCLGRFPGMSRKQYQA
ncbi:MAG TPA: hypothetical protein VNT75_15670 [Symbiobacteriaceae bacterium]|nr:hypothetical protein [Symbiobacteriaceae bacterium]